MTKPIDRLSYPLIIIMTVGYYYIDKLVFIAPLMTLLGIAFILANEGAMKE